MEELDERKVTQTLFDVQNEYLTLGSHRNNAEQWGRQSIRKFCTYYITHSQ